MAGSRRSSSILARLSLGVFAAASAAVLLIAVISIFGVYRLARAEDAQRADAYRGLMASDLDARFQIVDHIVTALADSPSVQTPQGASALLAARDPMRQFFEALMLVDHSGRVIESTDASEPIPPRLAGLAKSLAPGDISFTWLEPTSSDDGELWVARSAAPGLTPRIVVGQVSPEALLQVADGLGVGQGELAALIADSRGRPVRIGRNGIGFDSSTLRFSSGAASGTVTAVSERYGTMQGDWSVVNAATGLGWRVSVLSADNGAMDRVRSALAPAGLALLGLAALSVIVAFVYSRRIDVPLLAFERSAEDVASGGYIRPIVVKRDDRLGQVVHAFNEIGVRLNSLQDMARLLASAANLDDVLDAALNALGRILGSGDVAVLLSDERGTALVLSRGRGLIVPDAVFTASLDEPSPIAEAFRQQRTTFFLGSDSRGARAVHRLFSADLERPGVAVPLTAGSVTLGVIVVIAANLRPFTGAQVETLRAFSANAAVAVHTSRLFAEERASRMEAEALRAVAELTSPAAVLGQAIDRAGEIAAELLGYREWGVVLEGREQLGMASPAATEADAMLSSVWRLVLAARPDRDVADSAPIVVDGTHEDLRLEAMLGPSWGAALFVPLLQARTTRGALILHDQSDKTPPTERQVAVARTIGQQISLAIRNAHLLQDARVRAVNLETVFRISQTVSSELQLNVVLNRVLDVVQRILSADAVALMSHDDARDVIETTMARGVTSRDIVSFSSAGDEDIPGRVLRSRAPLVFGGLADRSTRLAALASDEGFDSLLAVPLMARGRAIGVLIAFASKADAFSVEDMELMMTFASQAALAVDTAALYGKEHRVASVLQASILPEVLPAVPGLESASFYLPSGTEAEIGGDYYDMFLTADGRVVLAIGDVCGKGVAAATKTSVVKYGLRGLIGAGVGPAAALAELNRQLAAAGDPSDIVTVWLGIVDLVQGRLTYANGGHPPGLLMRAVSGEVVRLAASGPLLGALVDTAYSECVVDFGAGDLLLLYTDGVTESRRGPKFFGEGRVRRVLRKSATADGCTGELLKAVERFSAGPLRDDAAALAVRRVSDEG
jgi:serine phosphatase RsbU (regulator of sigma subunit)